MPIALRYGRTGLPLDLPPGLNADMVIPEGSYVTPVAL